MAARVRIPLGLPIDGLVFRSDELQKTSDLVESISLGAAVSAGSYRGPNPSICAA